MENEIMSEKELENVVGGSSGYVYYAPFLQDGVSGYLYVNTKNPLNSKAEVVDVYLNKNTEEIIEEVPGGHIKYTSTLLKGFVAQNDVATFMEIMSGEKFIDFNSME